MGESSERVSSTASSPGDRAGRKARPLVAALLTIAAVLVAAVLVLPQGPLLTTVMVLGLAAVIGLPLGFRRASGSRKFLEGMPPALIAGGYFGTFLAANVAGQYLFLGSESGSGILPGSVLTAALLAGFMAWATRPVEPRPPQDESRSAP